MGRETQRQENKEAATNQQIPKSRIKSTEKQSLQVDVNAALRRAATARPSTLSHADFMSLQQTIGNRGVSHLVAGTMQRQQAVNISGPPVPESMYEPGPTLTDSPVEEEVAAPSNELSEQSRARMQEQMSVPIGGHHVMVREINGELRLGMASVFTEVTTIVNTLLDPKSPLKLPQRKRVKSIRDEVAEAEAEMNTSHQTYQDRKEEENALRDLVTQDVSEGYGKVRKKRNISHPRYSEYQDARYESSEAWQAYLETQADAINLAKDAILQLWEIGKDFLPTNLMPVGEVYRDKAVFGGNLINYTYHTGKADDPIPITWYKKPTDYPDLELNDGTKVKFGAKFTAGGKNFGLADANVPKADWLLQKTMHNETREGQREFNKTLIDNDVKVQKGGGFVSPPLGDTHEFDGDHVKDLGFGGADAENNYWPLDSTINRRAFTGYNSGYVVHYKDDKGHKSRAIGGLVGKWFQVRAFLNRGDGPIPAEGVAAGGTHK